MLEAQTLLLFDSIRRYGGRFSECPLYALSPRTGQGISRAAGTKLGKLGATYIDKTLNTECPEYGSANRVAAAAYIEKQHPHEILVILDSDTLFLREPAELFLPREIDVAVRPVDVKGMSTSGASDSCDRYWQELCNCSGVAYEAIPWRRSFIDEQTIKANYNGGLVAVRSDLGILQRWADFFFRSVRQGLKPFTNAGSFRTGAGWIEPAAGNLWGSNQAALSLAIWQSTRRVQELPPTYNYPLTHHEKIPATLVRSVYPQLVHVHYHWLLAPDSLSTNPLFHEGSPLTPKQQEWLRAATPLA